MNKIRALRERHEVPGKEIIDEFSRAGTSNLKKREQHLSELNAKVEELKSEVSTLDNAFNVEEQNLCVKRQEYMAASNDLVESRLERDKLLLEVHQLESRRNHLQNQKPSSKDQEILKRGKKKFDCYKQLTGIRWDFGAPKGTLKGYVTDGKGYLHAFNYQKTEKNSSELEEELWKEIERGTRRSELADSVDDKNCPPNN